MAPRTVNPRKAGLPYRQQKEAIEVRMNLLVLARRQGEEGEAEDGDCCRTELRRASCFASVVLCVLGCKAHAEDTAH